MIVMEFSISIHDQHRYEISVCWYNTGFIAISPKAISPNHHFTYKSLPFRLKPFHLKPFRQIAISPTNPCHFA
jgi:hypothetical protein